MQPFAAVVFIYIFTAGSSVERKIKNYTYEDLFKCLRNEGSLKPQSSESRLFIFNLLKNKYNGEHWDIMYEKLVVEKIRSFAVILTRLWAKSARKFSNFYHSNKQWLKTEFIMPNIQSPVSSTSYLAVGRPPKAFAESSEKSKNRKIKGLLKSYSSPEIVYAAQCTLQKSGKRNTAMLLKESLTTPSRSTKIKKAYLSSLSIGITPYTADEALAFILDNNLDSNSDTSSSDSE